MSALEFGPPGNGRPAAGPGTQPRHTRVWLLIALGSGFGVLGGPFLSAVANHGQPVIGSLIAAQFPRLFAGLQHPNARELVAIGLSEAVPSPQE